MQKSSLIVLLLTYPVYGILEYNEEKAMTVLEKINEINDALKEIFDFTQTNETINSDFTEYLSTIGARNIPLNQMEKIFLPYVFERRIGG